MPLVLAHGSGLTSRVEEPPSTFRYSDNETDIVATKYAIADEDSKLHKRASSGD
jgi:hypothetical protein